MELTKIIGILSILVALFGMLALTNATDLANVKQYNAVRNEYTITANLGAGQELAKMRLITPQNFNVIDRGEGILQMVAEVEFVNYVKQTNALSKMQFYNERNKETNRYYEYRWRVKTGTRQIPTTNYICEGKETSTNKSCYKTIGYSEEDIYSNWVKFKEVSELPEGIVRVGIFTDVKDGDNMEWIPTWYGERLDEWASWTSGMNSGLKSYINFDQQVLDVGGVFNNSVSFRHHNATTNGTTSGTNIKGILGNAVNLSSGYSQVNFTNAPTWFNVTTNQSTISFWFNGSSTAISGYVLHWGTQADTPIVFIRRNDPATTVVAGVHGGNEFSFTGTNWIKNETWTHVVLQIDVNSTGTSTGSAVLWINGTIVGNDTSVQLNLSYSTTQFLLFGGRTGSASLVGKYDEFGYWDRILSPSEISDLYNSHAGITYTSTKIIYPTATSYTLPITQLNYTSGLDPTATCKWSNSSGAWNSSYVFADTNFTSANNVSSVFGSNSWTVYCNDTSGNTASDSVDFDIVAMVENSQSFNATTVISSQESYSINLTYDNSTYPTITANLIYNGTSYVGTKIGTGNNIVFLKSLFQNKTGIFPFYWEMTMVNSTGGSQFVNSSFNNQTVSSLVPLVITNNSCGAGYNTTYIFSFADEVTKNVLISNVSYNFNYGVSTGGTYLFGNLSNIQKLYVCLNISSPNYYIDSAEIDYRVGGYADRKYYLFRGLKVATNAINTTLYSLDSTLAVPFSFTVQDNQFTPQTNSFLSLLRWYPATNSYEVVEMGKTDNKGQTVGSIAVNTVDYRIGVYDINGNLLNLFDPIRFVCTTSPCSYNVFLPSTPSDYINIDGLQSSLTFNPTTKIFTYTWNDPTQATTSMNLTVYRDAYDTSTVICSLVGAGFTGLLSCDVSAYSGTVRAVVYRTASPAVPIDQLIATIGQAITDVAGGKTIGLFMSFVFFTFAILAGIWNPVVAMILGIVALIPALYFGAISYTVLIGVVLLVFITIHFLRRS